MAVIGTACGSSCAEEPTASCKAALLVIDVQRIWLHGDLRTIDGVWIVTRIGDLLPRVRAAGIPVVYIQDVSRNALERMLGFPESIAPLAGDAVSQKTVGNAFSETTLDQLLRGLGVSHLLISGLASRSCVDGTVQGARALGYEITIIADAHTGGDGGAQARRMKEIWVREGLDVARGEDIALDALCGARPGAGSPDSSATDG